MKRIWSIEEQIIEDNSTKLRLEFSSVHTDELTAGNEAPGNDDTVLLRLYTSDRQRVATFKLERSGRFIRCDVEPLTPYEDLAQHTGLSGPGETVAGTEALAGEPQSRDDEGHRLATGEPVASERAPGSSVEGLFTAPAYGL